LEIKLKKKQVSSTESDKQYQNLKQTEIIMFTKGVAPSTRPCSYTNVWTFCPNSLRTIPETKWPFN
jgi:hypothetical protein